MKIRKWNETQKILIILVAMVVVTATLLSIHLVGSKRETRKCVDEENFYAVEVYAHNIDAQMHTMEALMLPACKYLASLEGSERHLQEENVKMSRSLLENTDAKKALVCAQDGKGFWADGTVYQETALENLPDVFAQEGVHRYALEVESGKIECVEAYTFKQEGKLWCMALFYPLTEFERIEKSGRYDRSDLIVLIDQQGNPVARNISYSKFSDVDNFFTQPFEKKEKTLIQSILSKQNTKALLQYEEEEKYFYVVPLEEMDWSLAVGQNVDQINRVIEERNNRITLLLRILLIVIIIFVLRASILAISSRVKMRQNRIEWQRKVDTDSLTGLLNKEATERKIREYIKDHPNGSGMLVFLDLDNFKKINDTKGHAFGDEVLSALGTNLLTLFRATDIAGRIGGDEFMVFLKGISQQADVEKQSKKIVHFFRTFQVGDYVKYSVMASIGVALYAQDGDSFEALYRAADEALYQSKRNGKNQVGFCNSAYQEMADRINQDV